MYLVVIPALINYSIMSNSDLTFLKNNVKGMQLCKKRIRLIKYCKSKFNNNGGLF